MSILKLNVQDAKVPTLLEDGEYEVRVMFAEVKTSSKGNEYLNLRLEATDVPLSEAFYHMIMLPSDDSSKFKDEADMIKQNNSRLLQWIEFCKAVEVDPSKEVDVGPDFIGQTGRALVATKEDPEYGTKNVVRRFLTAR